jgi:hypothetical protein
LVIGEVQLMQHHAKPGIAHHRTMHATETAVHGLSAAFLLSQSGSGNQRQPQHCEQCGFCKS